MKAKKVTLIAVAAVAAVAILAGAFWLFPRAFAIAGIAYVSRWEFAAEYRDYAAEFNTVKDYVLKNYPSDEGRRLSVISLQNEHGRALKDYETEKYAELPADVQSALNTIAEKAFSQNASLGSIWVRGDRVDFYTSKGYHLVYSPDGKPTWLRSPDDETEFRVKRIKDGWYHVMRK